MINLDTSKEMSSGKIVHGRVGDNNSCTETVSIINNDGTPFDLSGFTITFMGNTHEYKTKVINTSGARINDAKKGLFQFTFPNEAFSVAGSYERAYFQFTGKNNLVITTGDFEIIVFENTDLTAKEAETIVNEYNKLVDDLQKLQKQNISDLQKQQNAYIQSSDDEFKAIQKRIVDLKTQIDNYQTAVGQMASDAVNAVDEALNEFKAGAFYTQIESDNRFAKKADLNKNNVGLGNVDNFATATQEEAEVGLAKDKFMTPFLVFKAIAKWVQGKFVTPEDLLNKTYPIGAVFFSVNSASPSLLIGGTWERFAKGQVLVGVDEDDPTLKTAGTNGGSTNPLTSHYHVISGKTYAGGTSGTGTNTVARSKDLGSPKDGAIADFKADTQGSNTNHANWQPFTTVYIWKRIA